MLSLSSKYAIRALLYMAKHPEEGFIRVDQLSAKAKVPGPYLSKIMKKLAQNNIIESRRGLTGGVRLRQIEITFYNICIVMNDPIVRLTCILSKSRCKSANPCSMHSEWGKIRDKQLSFLKRAKITSLPNI